MKNTYQLSQSGIERLERFKLNIESDKCQVIPEFHNGQILYYSVHDAYSVTCCFVKTEEEAKLDALKQMQTSLTGEIEKNEFGFVVCGGCGLGKSDVELIKNN